MDDRIACKISRFFIFDIYRAKIGTLNEKSLFFDKNFTFGEIWWDFQEKTKICRKSQKNLLGKGGKRGTYKVVLVHQVLTVKLYIKRPLNFLYTAIYKTFTQQTTKNHNHIQH